MLKKRQEINYLTLFLSVFQLSACTFGGGFVIVPLMRKKFVEELHWIEEQEMLDLTAIAQSSPGPIAVNAAVLIGYRVAGIKGALITILGSIMPPLIIISIISLFYQAFRDNRVVSMVMAGMLCGVTAVLFDVVIEMTKGVLKKNIWGSLLIMLGVFLALRVFSVNILMIILVCGVLGALRTLYHAKNKEGESRK